MTTLTQLIATFRDLESRATARPWKADDVFETAKEIREEEREKNENLGEIWDINFRGLSILPKTYREHERFKYLFSYDSF